uniref:Uncharacterized protein n=1 Tax=Picea glauca TaxID=3330 RepID=A0A101LXV2_PICGL|nr:hypothetical protein ABT39_MTgene5554 [Picea glauca]
MNQYTKLDQLAYLRHNLLLKYYYVFIYLYHGVSNIYLHMFQLVIFQRNCPSWKECYWLWDWN